MISDDRIVRLARAWLGTPYHHQASLQGVGCDCLGLVRGIWRALYGEEPEPAPPYTPDWSEVTHREDLALAAARWFHPASADLHRNGGLILFRMRDTAVAKHLGIATFRGGAASFVHAYSGHGVVESHLTPPWQRRIAARFTFPLAD